MVTRLLILLAVTIVVLGGWGLLRLWRTAKLRQLAAYAPLSKLVPIGKAAVVAFTAPYCRDCETLQAPALERLKANLRESITVTTVSALEHPELVDQLGILTVPSTVVVDARGTVKHLNLGYASDKQLRDQLELATA
ncbi:MAG TPA: thioredoxin family protein [Anaerolineae bacterium]